jgi:hypothetical protein
MSNVIWEKVETALVRYVRDRYLFMSGTARTENKMYPGFATGQKEVPHIVAECHEGEPESMGKPTGNWICKANFTVTTKNSDETGQTNSARFGLIMDALLDDQAAEGLTSGAEQFTCFLAQVTRFSKHVQGDELVCEIGLTLHCAPSVIS